MTTLTGLSKNYEFKYGLSGGSASLPAYPAIRGAHSMDQPCRLTISLIQIGANGDVQPLETG
jgi:hypothetical protein